MAKEKARTVIWRRVLWALAAKNPPAFTVADCAAACKLAYPNAAQVLKHLRAWGYVRAVGFAPAAGGLGRQRKVYEVTEKGQAKAARDNKGTGG